MTDKWTVQPFNATRKGVWVVAYDGRMVTACKSQAEAEQLCDRLRKGEPDPQALDPIRLDQ